MTHFDVVIPGHYFCDIIFSGLPEFPSLGHEIYGTGLAVVPGGGVLNTSIALGRLGVHVGWRGMLGTDFFSRFIGECLIRDGVSTDLVEYIDQPFMRATTAISFPQDRAFVSYVDPSPDLYEMLTNLPEDITFQHLHFTGLHLHQGFPALFSQLRAKGVIVSMDCQYRSETINDPLVREVLSQLDIFMPNASEAVRLTQETDLSAAIRCLGEWVPCVVVKNGAQGSIGYMQGHIHVQPAYPVTPLDTTGAGDVFNGGFVAAHLRGLNLVECLRWGNYCGAQSTLGYGNSTAPTLAQLLDNMNHLTS